MLFHDGVLIESDLAYFYAKENFFKATGDVVFTQGDSLRMTCNKIEYNGDTKVALAQGDVFLERPDMSLKTEKLNIDRVKNEAFYMNSYCSTFCRPGRAESCELRLHVGLVKPSAPCDGTELQQMGLAWRAQCGGPGPGRSACR